MNAAEAQEIKALLLRTDDRYRRLAEEHHQLDDRLHQLTRHPHPSHAEQLEEVTLKKRKLALKDRMEEIARHHAHARHDRAS
jgi:uncharacterized protein YdcH (DUF465 family)